MVLVVGSIRRRLDVTKRLKYSETIIWSLKILFNTQEARDITEFYFANAVVPLPNSSSSLFERRNKMAIYFGRYVLKDEVPHVSIVG